MQHKKLYLKIGSGPGTRCRVFGKRLPLKAEDVVELIPFPYPKYGRKIRVRVNEIRDVGEPLYVVERW